MYKVNYKDENHVSVNFFQIFKTKNEADNFIKQLGDSFVSMKMI